MLVYPALLVGSLLLGAGRCQAQTGDGYQVMVDIKGLTGEAKVYLINGSQLKVVDSAAVRTGQFVLRGHLAEPAYMYLHAGRGRASKMLADILLDNRVLHVTGTAPVYDSVQVSGSPIDQSWKEWMREDEQLGIAHVGLKHVSQAMRGKSDTATARALQIIAGELQAVRVRLLKAYVRRYHDTAVGAALPTLCTLGPSLTADDYWELHRTLTPA